MPKSSQGRSASRAAKTVARMAGELFYQGVVCSTCDSTTKYVANGKCVHCARHRQKRPEAMKGARVRALASYRADPQAGRVYSVQWKLDNPDKVAAQRRQRIESGRAKLANAKRRAEEPEAVREYARVWYAANADRVKAQKRAAYDPVKQMLRAKYYRDTNPEKMRASSKRWAQANPGRCVAQVALRNARKRLATPMWLSKEHLSAINAIYESAAATRDQVVDHIVPLAGCRTCKARGLHVPWNLQLLPETENARKCNHCQDCWGAIR